MKEITIRFIEVYNYLLDIKQVKNASDFAEKMLHTFTFYAIPILNPDGARLYTRENANKMDLNRDFLQFSQPESQLLFQLFKDEKPDFIFYLSGVDILATDKLGRLSVSLADCKERDRFVFSLCKQHEIPVVVALGGGYSPDIKDIVEAHCNTFRLAMDFFS